MLRSSGDHLFDSSGSFKGPMNPPRSKISLEWSDQDRGMGENEFDGLGYCGETSAQSRQAVPSALASEEVGKCGRANTGRNEPQGGRHEPKETDDKFKNVQGCHRHFVAWRAVLPSQEVMQASEVSSTGRNLRVTVTAV
jgi:hypothetical protein